MRNYVHESSGITQDSADLETEREQARALRAQIEASYQTQPQPESIAQEGSSDDKLLDEANEILEALRRKAAKADETRELDEFAGRIADKVSDAVNQQLAGVELG